MATPPAIPATARREQPAQPAARDAEESPKEAVRAVEGRFILLMRHGSREHSPFVPEKDQGLSEEGVAGVEEAAATLHGLLEGSGGAEQLKLGTIYHGSYGPTRATADALVWVLKRRGHEVANVLPESLLDPHRFWNAPRGPSAADGRPSVSVTELTDNLCEGVSNLPAGKNALLIIGHQPQLGAIAREFTGEPEAIGAAEILCLQVECRREPEQDAEERKQNAKRPVYRWNRGGTIVWAITPSRVDKDAVLELRDKIKSKMETAKLLGTVIVAVLGWLIGRLFDSSLGTPLAHGRSLLYAATVLCLFGSLALYLATMYAYDRLLMPVRFWGEGAVPARAARGSWQRVAGRFRWAVRLARWRPIASVGRRVGRLVNRLAPKPIVCRPPSSSTRVLYQNMIRVWERLFVPATYVVGASLFLLALAAFLPDWRFDLLPIGVVLVVGVAVLAVVLLFVWIRSSRPQLGVQD